MAKSKSEQSQDTKHTIVLAAYDLARREGVGRLSANAIAQNAGISKGGFFHHFPQVDDLYLYILDELMTSLQQSASLQAYPTFTLFIDHIADSLLGMYQTNSEVVPMLLHFFSLCPQNPAYRERLHTASTKIFSAWSERLGEYTHEAKADNLGEVTRLIDIFFLGFGIHNLLFDDPKAYRALAHEFGEMVEARYFRR